MADEVSRQEDVAVALGAFRRLSERGEAFGFDRDSLAWVEDYIESNRGTFSEREVEAFIGLVGLYLGECVRQKYGGHWDQKDGKWGIFFDNNAVAFPFAKAHKFVKEGLAGGQSITSFFEVLPVVLKRKTTRWKAILKWIRSVTLRAH